MTADGNGSSLPNRSSLGRTVVTALVVLLGVPVVLAVAVVVLVLSGVILP
jgi:hypothetical protein